MTSIHQEILRILDLFTRILSGQGPEGSPPGLPALQEAIAQWDASGGQGTTQSILAEAILNVIQGGTGSPGAIQASRVDGDALSEAVAELEPRMAEESPENLHPDLHNAILAIGHAFNRHVTLLAGGASPTTPSTNWPGGPSSSSTAGGWPSAIA